MVIRFYGLDDGEKRQLSNLEDSCPDIAMETVVEGFDGNTFVQVYVPLLQSVIEALGVVIAAWVAVQGTHEKSDKATKENDLIKKTDNRKRVVYIDENGAEKEINSIDDYNLICQELNDEKGKCNS